MNVPPAPLFFRRAVRHLYVEQGRPLPEGAALFGHKLAKIRMRVQRRKRPKNPISAGI